MPDAGFVREIVEQSRPTIHSIGTLDYASKKFTPIFRPQVDPVGVSTLTAVVDYCQRELVEGRRYIVHVQDYRTVDVYAADLPETRQREQFLSAACAAGMYRFGEFLPVENFVVAMQAQFVQDDITAQILALVGNIAVEAKQTVDDDGVTQRVTTKAGIVKTEDRDVPNPVVLKPYRTFPEIEQPESRFVLRLDVKGPVCALFEADGGAWKNAAIANIAEFLNGHLGEQIESRQITVLA